MRTLSLEELLARLLIEPQPTLIEALNLKAYREGHLPGALHLPRSVVRERAQTLLPDVRAEIIVYCRDKTWHAGRDVGRELMSLGYENVADFEGGKEAWLRAGLKLEQG